MSRILITSALPGVNGVKHLGNLVGSMLPADVLARFCRARGYDTLAICATDEHGAPIELAAAEFLSIGEYYDGAREALGRFRRLVSPESEHAIARAEKLGDILREHQQFAEAIEQIARERYNKAVGAEHLMSAAEG